MVMSQRYLLPCNCGKSVVIQIGQAGQDVMCLCGQKITVPGMREIRRLPAADATPASKPARTAPGATGFSPARAVFALAISLVFLALTFAGYMWVQRSQLQLGPTQQEHRSAEEEFIDAMTPETTWDAWLELRDQGLGDRAPLPFMVSRMLYNDAGRAIWSAMIVAVIAGALAAAAAFVDRKKGL